VSTRPTAAHVLDALGDPTRRAVLEIVREGPTPVGRIAGRLPVSRPAVSRHLRLLEGAGLVTATRSGRERLYVVAPDGLGALRQWVADLWDDALESLDRHVTSDRPVRSTR
jgi:DNA-binding transcriptional ArsR family regulator